MPRFDETAIDTPEVAGRKAAEAVAAADVARFTAEVEQWERRRLARMYTACEAFVVADRGTPLTSSEGAMVAGICHAFLNTPGDDTPRPTRKTAS